jgi:excisionase family DNA binding protein
MENEKIMTSKEVMAYLRISHQTLLNLRYCGLKYIKLGKKVLFRKSDIDQYMEDHTIAPKKKGRREGR